MAKVRRIEYNAEQAQNEEKERVLKEIYKLCQTAGISDAELSEGLKNIRSQEQKSIPLSIFKPELGIIEAAAKYLKDNYSLKYSEIAELLHKTPKSIWLSCRSADRKHPARLLAHEISNPTNSVPVSIFHNHKLGALESLVLYLKESRQMKYSEIGRLLSRDPRTIWISYSKAKKK